MASALPPPTDSGRKVILRGGFSSISGLEFQGQNLVKGRQILDNLFNIEEVQEEGKATTISARILRTTSINESW